MASIVEVASFMRCHRIGVNGPQELKFITWERPRLFLLPFFQHGSRVIALPGREDGHVWPDMIGPGRAI
jgi:hypothetical protein